MNTSYPAVTIDDFCVTVDNEGCEECAALQARYDRTRERSRDAVRRSSPFMISGWDRARENTAYRQGYHESQHERIVPFYDRGDE